MNDNYERLLQRIAFLLLFIVAFHLSQWLYWIIEAGTCRGLIDRDFISWFAREAFC